MWKQSVGLGIVLKISRGINMRIIVLTITISFLFISGGFATEEELQAEHGQELTKASFIMRYKFHKDTGVDWKESSYEERMKFLEEWHNNLSNEAKAAEQEARNRGRSEMDLDRQKNDNARREEERKRNAERAASDKRRSIDDRQKKLERSVRDRERTISDMRRHR